jgi:FMN phosphatase YigB (HAD superfamily)
MLGTLYGPNLVDQFKDGPEYYRRVFADARVDPARSLVVDDSAAAVGWAKEAGANTCLIGPADGPASADIVLPSLAALGALIVP